MAKPSARQDSDIAFLKFDAFASVKAGVAHGFFGRRGGVSTGLYASLNCGPGSNDDPEAVKTNRARVAEILGAESGRLLSLHQIHSAECIAAKEPWSGERPKADSLVTNVPGLALSILTADCAPVLFHGRAGAKPVIGAAHAGWKGAIGGVLENTVKKMTGEYGVDPVTIRAAVGPSIQKKSYEVSSDFYKNFIDQNEDNDRFFQQGRKEGHLMFDLPGYCAARLAGAGIENIQISEADTYADEAGYFSYRRTTHRQEKDYGRQISAIVIL